MSAQQLERGILRLRRALTEVEALDPSRLDRADPWGFLRPVNTKVQTALDETFPPGSLENNRYRDAADIGWNVYFGSDLSHNEKVTGVTNSRVQSIQLLTAAIELLEDRLEEVRASGSTIRTAAVRPKQSAKVFVVHGHDDAPKESVARFIERLGLVPIILHEQPNKGRTVIEKFLQETSDVGFAVVIMTPDDEMADGQKRARQNVILELGFFIGRLGPSRVAALVKEPVEKPSDYAGVIYTAIDSGGAWKFQLAKELKAAGYDVDMNNAI